MAQVRPFFIIKVWTNFCTCAYFDALVYGTCKQEIHKHTRKLSAKLQMTIPPLAKIWFQRETNPEYACTISLTAIHSSLFVAQKLSKDQG